MNVTLSEVKRAARAHRAPLAGESAGYLVLALADQVLGAPRVVAASDVQLGEDGALRILRGQASSESEAELSLRRALDELLLVASSGSAALMRAGRRPSPVGLSGLVKELEAALIPVNRGAAKRALARLQRETARAVANGELPQEVPEPSVAPAPSFEPELSVAPALELESQIEPWLPPQLSNLDAVVTALCDEPVFESELLGEDELEIVEEVEEDEASAALTVALNFAQASVAVESELPAPVELPTEACTRPEPVILRQALRPLADIAWPRAESLTPALGSLARELPVLSPEQIAQASRANADELTVCSAPLEECTVPTPEVEPLEHGRAIVASRRSDVSELLAGFSVGGENDEHRGLCRAIKEIAELELTPAPFGALIRG